MRFLRETWRSIKRRILADKPWPTNRVDDWIPLRRLRQKRSKNILFDLNPIGIDCFIDLYLSFIITMKFFLVIRSVLLSV
jgi:hypothetical protein